MHSNALSAIICILSDRFVVVSRNHTIIAVRKVEEIYQQFKGTSI